VEKGQHAPKISTRPIPALYAKACQRDWWHGVESKSYQRSRFPGRDAEIYLPIELFTSDFLSEDTPAGLVPMFSGLSLEGVHVAWSLSKNELTPLMDQQIYIRSCELIREIRGDSSHMMVALCFMLRSSAFPVCVIL